MKSALNGGNKLITELAPAAAVRETHRSAGRFSLSALLVVACAIALFVLPGSASAAIGISNFTYTNTSAPGSSLPGTRAASHPNVTIAFNRTGSEGDDVKNVQVGLPAGVFPNPEAVSSKCTDAQFTQDKCPSGSNVGTVTVDVTAASLLPMTINGSVDVIQPNPNAVATMGLTLRPEKICILFVFCAVPEKIMLETDAAVDTWSDHHVETTTAGSPKKATIGIPMIFWTPTMQADITIKRMALSFQSRAGDWGSHQECSGPWWWRTCKTVADPPSGNYFWWQSPSCEPATAKAKLTAYSGQVATATATSTPTDCALVPFDPQLTFTPENTDSNQSTKVSFKMTQSEADATIQQSFPKFVDADLPAGSGLDLNALSGVTNCTDAQLKASSCPASSEIGTAYAFSKFMPGATASTPGLTGKVYATSVTSQVEMAVLLDGPRGTKIVLRGVMGARDGHVYSTFTSIPQVPFREFGLTIDKAAYKNPASCGAADSSIKLTGYSGAEADRSTSYTVDNCATPPDTTIETSFVNDETDYSKVPFVFSSDQTGVSFQCSIDGGGWQSCSSPWTTQALTLGQHTFRVKALKDVVEDLTPAEYVFTVVPSSYSIAADIDLHGNTQAVAHPDVDATFTVGGVGTPKSLALSMPRGFAASLAAVSLCDAGSDALVGTCPSTSKVGTASLKIINSNGDPETGEGDLFLTDGPTGSDAGGIATKLTFKDAGGNPTGHTLIATGGAYLVENGAHQYLELRDIPDNFGGAHFQATELAVHLDGNAGGNQFLTNPSNCDVSSWEASSVNHNDVEAPAFSVPFQATGCANVPFGPQLVQTLANPVAGETTGVNAHLEMLPVPSGSIVDRNSAVQSLTVLEPRVIAPNFPSFGTPQDQCSPSSVSDAGTFDPTGCPAWAKVGTMTIDTPLLVDPLEGTVWLIEASPIPWLGVIFDQPGIKVSMVGITSTPKVNPSCNPLLTPGGCPTRIAITFDGVPDVQIDSIDMDLNGPDRPILDTNGNPVLDSNGNPKKLSGKILQLASPTDKGCNKISIASTDIAPWSDPTAVVTQTQTINIPNCNY
jgi:hypothetical protein